MYYASEQLFMQILNCFISLIAFIIPALLILLPVRFLTKVPSFVFRKLLHIVGFTCVSIMLLNAKSWLAPVICYILIAVLLYPVLAFLEHAPWFEKLFVQKTPGEIKRSLLLLFFMCAALVTVSWGIFGQPHLAPTAILMWVPEMQRLRSLAFLTADIKCVPGLPTARSRGRAVSQCS